MNQGSVRSAGEREIRDTWRCNTGCKPVRGVCDDDTQDTSHTEIKGCWEHPRIPGTMLEA